MHVPGSSSGFCTTMPRKRKQPGFTLIELLVVMAIISLLASILMPTLKAAQNLAMRSQCLSNLRNLGTATGHYQADNSSYFWPVSVMNYPTAGMRTYFWGTNSQPVDFKASAFLRITGSPPGLLWCPSLRWGTYVPQGAVNEPTTTYGYNAWCLDPPGWGRPLPRKQGSDILQSASLFVFGDSAMFWSPGGVPILQNSTYLEYHDGQPFGGAQGERMIEVRDGKWKLVR